MYQCICICIERCIYMCVSRCMYMYIYIYVCVRVCACVYIYMQKIQIDKTILKTCEYKDICQYIHVNMYMSVCV